MGLNALDFLENKYISVLEIDKPYTLEIRAVVGEQVRNPKTNKMGPKLILYFKVAKKGMVLNQTNLKTIIRLFGAETDGWVGQAVELRPEKKEAFGKIVDTVVVYAAPKQEAPPGRPIPPPEPETARSSERSAKEGTIDPGDLPKDLGKTKK